MVKVHVKRIGTHDLPLPAYENDGAAGMDLRVCVQSRNPAGGEGWDGIHVKAGATVRLHSGFAFSIPSGHEGQVRPRGSSNLRGLNVHLETINSGYGGEVFMVVTAGNSDVQFRHGERIALFVIAPVVRAELVETDDFPDSAPGSGCMPAGPR
ncbi:dUTP diphosphatase [Myxococcus eversor]|uniref:dUTP diphosphatase n=1 Tax=Myxococcus eversor TaxID=2709661 RepID=UPI0013D61A3E|nr:dUTP diphosphatase [Myxococcus eversor]